MLEGLLNPDNPIVLLVERTRARKTPRWLHTLDTRIPYILLVGMVLFLLNGLDTDRNLHYYTTQPFGTINSRLFVLYMLIALRLTIEGVAIGRLVQHGAPDLLKTTAISTAHILLGIWVSTLRRMRAWVLLLVYSWALAALFLSIVTVDYRPGQASSLLTFLYSLCFLVPLSLFSVTGAIGLGAAMGTAFRRWEGAVAVGVAFTVQLIPTLVAVVLLILNSAYVPYRLDSILNAPFSWETFIAFGDSGLIALTRLAVYHVSLYGIERMSVLGVPPQVLLAMMCTLQVHLFLAVGSAVSLALQLRPCVWVADVRKPFTFWKGIDGVIPFALFIGAALALVALWVGTPRIPLTLDLPPFPYINRDLLRAVQYFMAFILTLYTLRAIAAGVYAAPAGDSGAPLAQFLSATRATVSRLRGWILGLSLLLMLLFVLLIIDHFMNGLGLRALAAHEGYWWHWGGYVRYAFDPTYSAFFLQWSPLQLIGAAGWAIIMGYGAIISGVVLGLGARLLWQRSWIALVGAVLMRVLPVLIGLLPPNYFTLPHPGLLATRLDRDPLFTIADSGLTVLIGLAEPGWTFEDHCGETLASFGVILGAITFYALLMVSILPLIIAWFRRFQPKQFLSQQRFRSRTPSEVWQPKVNRLDSDSPSAPA